jgi:hypothetical protein
VLELIPCWRMRSKMSSMNTKAQDGSDLWEADARWVSTTSFNTVHINCTLVKGPCDSKFWSEVDSMFAEVDCSWY